MCCCVGVIIIFVTHHHAYLIVKKCTDNMHCFRSITALFLLISIAESIVDIKPDDSCLRYLGRFNDSDSGLKSFDSPGFQLSFGVEGTNQVDILISVAKCDQPHIFWIYIDDVLGDNIIDTSNITQGVVTYFNLVKNLTIDYHTIRLVKVTEADYNNPYPKINFLTFHGIQLDSGTVKCQDGPPLTRKIEFIGDSITAGYCNMCKIDPASSGYSAESFALSWPFLVSAGLQASYHTTGQSALYYAYEHLFHILTLLPSLVRPRSCTQLLWWRYLYSRDILPHSRLGGRCAIFLGFLVVDSRCCCD